MAEGQLAAVDRESFDQLRREHRRLRKEFDRLLHCLGSEKKTPAGAAAQFFKDKFEAEWRHRPLGPYSARLPNALQRGPLSLVQKFCGGREELLRLREVSRSSRACTDAIFTGYQFYVFGGFDQNGLDSDVLRSAECLTVSTGTWEVLEPLATKWFFGTGAVMDGYLYTCGAPYHGGATATRLSLATKQWEVIASMNKRRTAPGVAVVGRRFYVCGGEDMRQQECHSSVEWLDLSVPPNKAGMQGAWRLLPVTMSAMRRLCVAAAIHGQDGKEELFVCGGFHTPNGIDYGVLDGADVIEVHGQRGSRQRPAPPMPSPRAAHAGASLGGRVYVCGGLGAEVQKARQPKEEDLQHIKITYGDGSEPVTVHAQRALWNAERAGERVSGPVAFDPENAYGLALPPARPGAGAAGRLALVHRGGPDGELGPFAVKAHRAAGAGAEAVLVISKEDRLPVLRLGGGTLLGDLKIALRTRTCGFPRVPVLLLPHTEGERMRTKCLEGVDVHAEFEIMPDQYPRRTLPKRLCQGCALMFSGIGILYGIIGCFDVEVGAEFTEAEVAATAQGIPCACIDVDMNRFWARVGAAVLPTPCNVASSLLSWLAFPRILARFLFPPRGNVDLVGSMILHLTSLSARTWIAFVVAGFGASTVASWTLRLFGDMSERGAEEAGVVSSQDRGEAQAWMMLLIEAYILPQVCQAVAASRDEAMYRSIVAKGRELNARRLVAVVGAGHANGILQYARTRGL